MKSNTEILPNSSGVTPKSIKGNIISKKKRYDLLGNLLKKKYPMKITMLTRASMCLISKLSYLFNIFSNSLCLIEINFNWL
jgi:hypothetical protein